MPCSDGRDHMTARELAAVEINLPYREVFGEETHCDVKRLDKDTARLCAWIKENGTLGASWSLRRWWENHKKMDRRREILEKLTPEEREILGI